MVEGRGWDGLRPDAVTGWTLVRAYHSLARSFRATLAEHGLTPTQFGALGELASDPGISQGELARRILLTPQSVGTLLVTLERRGLVERQAHGPGTAASVALTGAGRSALAAAVPAVLAMNRPDALGLTADEDATLNALLHKVVARES